MGKTKSTGTKSVATAEYKIKKLTPRRIRMIMEFLTKTIDSPDNFGDSFGRWIDRLIEFLREPKRCRSTKMDVLAWLQDDCFDELMAQVVRSTGGRTEPLSESVNQSINQVKLEPLASGEDIDMQALLPLCAIKTEKVEVEEQFKDQQGFQNDFQTATGNQKQEESWKLSAIKEEAEMITVKEEFMLDDEFDEKVDILKSENQDLKDEIPTAKLDKDQGLDLSLNRSAVALKDKILDSKQMDQVMEQEKSRGDSSIGYDFPFSSEEIPMLTPYIPTAAPEPTQPQSDEQKNELPRRVTFKGNESTDLIKNISDTMMGMVQYQQRRNDVSKDWDSMYQVFCIVKKVFKSIE